ncbi:helix-turn-helix domain-containing protein [Streptomyces roseirectus]|uniref:Helix-turn-helix domain-containing protein n=1 Tax=Streptomyces roseirectus TaxID=2768066 RepID=A0A7H0IJ86_9ACTN|nr:helix-turn-helix transcriptional regulator [Streptomyces roseirectus]QNP72852.1 helix-turn-helix domain-containing protein [Streptomyces roseirectus]
MSTQQLTQGNSTSSVLGRRLGGELAKLRLAAGLTQGHAAKVLTASTTKVAKMEGGWVSMRDPDIRALCELYAVHDPGVIGGLLELARVDRERRRAKGWWDDYAMSGVAQEYVALENAATAIKAWQPGYLPGLLQTPDYVRALRRAPMSVVTEETQPDDEFVESRLARQRRLHEKPLLTYQAVIYEAALRNIPGGVATVRGQLEELLRATEAPNVTLRVFPFSGGTHQGLNGPFTIISFAEPGAMDVVYMESPFNKRWVEGGEDAAAYDVLFEKIAVHSLSERESVTLLDKLRKEL